MVYRSPEVPKTVTHHALGSYGLLYRGNATREFAISNSLIVFH